MKNKHTGGPWRVSGYEKNVVLNDYEDVKVAVVENMKDVNLISCAPELLEALKAVHEWAKKVNVPNYPTVMVLDVLDKVDGRVL